MEFKPDGYIDLFESNAKVRINPGSGDMLHYIRITSDIKSNSNDVIWSAEKIYELLNDGMRFRLLKKAKKLKWLQLF